MTSIWNNEERAREWPIESLSPWAAAVVNQVESSGGDGESAYCSLFELADILGMWEERRIRGPGQVWTDTELRETRRRFMHLLEPMRGSSHLLPEHSAWITLQLTDLLNSTTDAFPTLSSREIKRRTLYLKLRGTAGRLIQTQFDVHIASCEADDGLDARRPATGDEDIAALMDLEHVRPRTLAEIADDLREEEARSYLPEHAIELLGKARLLAQGGQSEATSAMLERDVESLDEAMSGLGDFREPLSD